MLKRPHLRGARRMLLAQRVPPTRAASGFAEVGVAVKVMPNMSQTSRSYQLAAGHRSVMVAESAGDTWPRSADF